MQGYATSIIILENCQQILINNYCLTVCLFVLRHSFIVYAQNNSLVRNSRTKIEKILVKTIPRDTKAGQWPEINTIISHTSSILPLNI